MPINTGVGLMSLGKDVSVDVVLQNGQHLTLGNITMFDAKPITKQLASQGIDGTPRFAVVHEGWNLSLDVDRSGRSADDWWDLQERAYFNGDVLQNVTITETIDEPDGSISQWRFEGCALALEDGGSWKSDSYVKMRIKGSASFRKRVR